MYDVTNAILDGTNIAAMQSYDSGSGGDNMYTLTSILVTTLDNIAPVVSVVDPVNSAVNVARNR